MIPFKLSAWIYSVNCAKQGTQSETLANYGENSSKIFQQLLTRFLLLLRSTTQGLPRHNALKLLSVM